MSLAEPMLFVAREAPTEALPADLVVAMASDADAAMTRALTEVVLVVVTLTASALVRVLFVAKEFVLP